MTDQTRPLLLKPADKAVAGLFIAAIALAVVAAGYGLYVLLPVLVELAKDTIVLGVEVFVLLGFAAGLLQLWLARDAAIYKFKQVAQNARRKVAADNPIGTIDIAIATFEGRLERIDAEAVSANSALLRLKDKVKNRKGDGMLDMASREAGLADAAEHQGRPDSEIQQHAVAAERWKKAAETVQPMVEDQEFIQGQLAKARDLATNALADLKNQRAVLSVQYDAYRESQAQAKAFRRFFGKNPELEMIDFAVEAIEKQTTDTQADIDQLMHQLTPRIQAAQLARDAEAAEAMRKRAEAKQLAEPAPAMALPKAKDTVAVNKQ